MHAARWALPLLAIAGAAAAQSPQEGEVMEAALRLKRAHVGRSWEACRSRGAPEAHCRKLLEITREREKRVLARIAPALTDPAVNVDQLNAEMAACYNPNNTYEHLVDCWVRLADRLDAARKGKSLLRR